jgi:DNA-binding response OmpR family regulator
MTDAEVRPITRIAQFGEFSLDFGKMELCRGDEPVILTLQEFKVLKFFLSKPEVVVSRPKLIAAVWPKRKRSSFRTVDNCIAKLRQKIERNPTHPAYLLTVHGVGYKFVPQQKHRPQWPTLADGTKELQTIGKRPGDVTDLSRYEEQRRK